MLIVLVEELMQESRKSRNYVKIYYNPDWEEDVEFLYSAYVGGDQEADHRFDTFLWLLRDQDHQGRGFGYIIINRAVMRKVSLRKSFKCVTEYDTI